MGKPSVLVLLAQGCEELEAVTVIDLLRRADCDVVSAGLDSLPVTASRGVRLLPDTTLDLALNREYDMVVLPGGMGGAQNLSSDARVTQLLKKMAEGDLFTCAICAAPMVLAGAGILTDRRVTCYPGCLEKLELPGVASTGGAVERDGKIVTSRSPGTAMDFALALIEALLGKSKRDEVEKPLVR
jgi:protein deglycase